MLFRTLEKVQRELRSVCNSMDTAATCEGEAGDAEMQAEYDRAATEIAKMMNHLMIVGMKKQKLLEAERRSKMCATS